MMRRRALSVLAGGAAVPLAGCLSGETSSDSPGGEAALTRAKDRIARATELLVEEASISFTRSPAVSIQTNEILLTLTDAQAALDDVANDAGAVSDDRLQAYRSYTTALEELTTALISVRKGLNTLSAANAYRRTERYEDAAAEVETAEELFTATSETIATSQEQFSGVNTELLDTDAVNQVGISSVYTNIETLVDAYLRYSDATLPYYEGLNQYWAGVKTYGEMKYREAELLFVEASGRFDIARSGYLSAESEVSASVQEVFIEQTCVAESMQESSEQYIEATIQVRNGNGQQANRHIDRATTARDRDCGVS